MLPLELMLRILSYMDDGDTVAGLLGDMKAAMWKTLFKERFLVTLRKCDRADGKTLWKREYCESVGFELYVFVV